MVRQASGKTKSFPVTANGFGLELGKNWLATTIQETSGTFGDKPSALELINRATGKFQRIEGLQAVCWSPDGTKLVARRVGDPLSSPLVLLDPNKPNDLVELGTVPGLAIYSGTWVRGEVPS